MQLQLLVCACVLGAGGIQGLGTIKDDVLLGWGWGWGRARRCRSRVSEDLRSQLEPGSPDSQSGSWGSRRVSGCSETPQGGGAGLGQAGSAYKWAWSGAPSQSRWPPAGAAPSLWTPVTQAFVCSSSSRRVASLGKMPECWDGVSEGCRGGEVVGKEGASLCLCLVADLPSVASPWGELRQGQQVLAPGGPGLQQ